MTITRVLGIILIALAGSLALLLLITHRNLGPVPEPNLTRAYMVLLDVKDPAALTVDSLLGPKPPAWAKRAAIIWHRADPIKWWWVPIVFVLVQVLVVRRSRKRMAGG